MFITKPCKRPGWDGSVNNLNRVKVKTKHGKKVTMWFSCCPLVHLFVLSELKILKCQPTY